MFELSPPAGQQTQWRERVLWSFGASGDGWVPFAGLIADKWGNLYGTTEFGGANSGSDYLARCSSSVRCSANRRSGASACCGASAQVVTAQAPYAGLIAESGESLRYDHEGGANGSNAGTVFELSPPLGQAGAMARERAVELRRKVVTATFQLPA